VQRVLAAAHQIIAAVDGETAKLFTELPIQHYIFNGTEAVSETVNESGRWLATPIHSFYRHLCTVQERVQNHQLESQCLF
jgi:hypothetical protein